MTLEMALVLFSYFFPKFVTRLISSSQGYCQLHFEILKCSLWLPFSTRVDFFTIFILWWIKSVSSRVTVVLSCHLFWDKFVAFHEACFIEMPPTLLSKLLLDCLFTLFSFDIGDQVILFCYSPVYVVFVFCPWIYLMPWSCLFL